MYELTRLNDYDPITDREPETDKEMVAKEIARSDGHIVDVCYMAAHDRYVIFSWHEYLHSKTLAVLADHELTVRSEEKSLIQHSHAQLHNEHDEPFEATFTAEEEQ